MANIPADAVKNYVDYRPTFLILGGIFLLSFALITWSIQHTMNQNTDRTVSAMAHVGSVNLIVQGMPRVEPVPDNGEEVEN